jgi:SNF2 family DNA or RNA helicase
MTPVQAKLYDIMREDMVLAIKSNGEAASEQIRSENVMSLSDYLMKEGYKVDREMLKKGIVTAKIETVAMMRLHQITCGHINTQDGGVKTFDGGKIEYLSEHLEQWCDPFEDNKSIIFTAYRPSVELLTNLAAKLDIGVLALTGKTSGKAQEMVRQFQTDPGVRLFVINLAAGSTGITLTRANRVCYYASTYNWMHRRQSEDRAHRIGQTRSVMYTDLMIRNSIEQHVLNKLEGKADMQARTTTSFLELFA